MADSKRGRQFNPLAQRIGKPLLRKRVDSILAPTAGIGWFSLVPNFEIQGRPLLSAAVSDSAYGGAGAHPFTHFTQQALVVGLETHIALAVVDNHQQAGTAQPVCVHYTAMVD